MIKTVASERVRKGLRGMLDDTLAGHEIVIERYRKPLAVLVNHDEWQELKQAKKRILELETILEARRLLAQTPKTGSINHWDLKQKLEAKAPIVDHNVQ